MLKIAIPVGHSILASGACSSAGGYVQEYKYCKELAPLVKYYLELAGHKVDVIICPERKFEKPIEEKGYKLGKINGKGYDLVVELHLNAFNGNAKGTEVLYYSEKGKAFAQRVNDKLDDIFTDRNVKQRKDLYILKQTDCPAILVEAFFCDNKEDYEKANEPHEMKLIAKKIAEGVHGKDIVEPKPIVEDKQDDVFYVLKAGTYSIRENVENRKQELEKLGIKDLYIDITKK